MLLGHNPAALVTHASGLGFLHGPYDLNVHAHPIVDNSFFGTGTSNHGHQAGLMDSICGLPNAGTLSANFDLSQIFAFMVHHLSNQFEGRDKTRDMMLFLMEQAPQNLVRQFLRLGSLAVKALWMPLADWSFELNKKQFFEQVMQVSLRCEEWVNLHGARCLILAAYFGCPEIASTIISYGVTPNEVSYFKYPTTTFQTPDFSKLGAFEWRRHMNLNLHDLDFDDVATFPLIEAAARGNREILVLLKDDGVNSQLRSGGLTAAGHAVFAHKRGAIDTDELLCTLSLLLDIGEEIDAPLWQRDTDAHTIDYELRAPVAWSEETLLDAVYLRCGNSSLFQEMKARSQAPHGVLTVTGILLSAMDGNEALHHYMAAARYPAGLPRKRIEEVALVRSLLRPRAFDSMIKNGFTMEFTTLLDRDNIGADGCDGLPDEFDVYDSDFLLRNLPKFSESVAKYITDWLTEDRLHFHIREIDASVMEILMRNLKSDQLRRLGPKLLEISVEWGDTEAVKLCLEAGVSLEKIDLLRARNNDGWYDTEILDLLYKHGARPSLSPEDLESRDFLKDRRPKHLQWLITHGLDINGMSVYDIVMGCLEGRRNMEEIYRLGQWLSDHGYPIYAHPSRTLGFQQSGTDQNDPCLALLVCLGCSIDLILQLLDQGVDVNPQQAATQSLDKTCDFKKQQEPSDWKSESPLITAVWKNNIPMVEALLNHGAEINGYNEFGYTALDIAVGVYVQASNTNDKTVRKQLIVTLLERGANPDNEPRSIHHRTASPSLVLAVESSSPDLQLIQLLLEMGASLKWDDNSLLRYMFSSSLIDLRLTPELFKLLLASGARYNSSEELVCACAAGDIGLIQFHLENGANPNAQIRGHSVEKYLRGLDKAQGRPYRGTFRPFRPLTEIAIIGNVPLAQVLLAAGATLTGEDNSLFEAAHRGRLDMVSLLLPLEKRLEQVTTALERTEKERFFSIVELLRQAKAKLEA